MVKRKSFADMDCSVAQALEDIGDPWSLLIVRTALDGATRFDDFHHRLGIPRTTLATRLAALVDHGVLERVPYQERPVRHDYHLTDKGRDLHPVIITLMCWGDRWTTRPGPTVLIDADTERPLDLALVDLATGRTIDQIAVVDREA